MKENDMIGPALVETKELAKSIAPAPKKSRTAKATKARMKTYDASVRAIVKPLKECRALGFESAAAIAEWLNAKGIPAPSEIIWTKSSVLRAIRRLVALGLEPKPFSAPPEPLLALDLTKPAHYKIYLEAIGKTAKSAAK